MNFSSQNTPKTVLAGVSPQTQWESLQHTQDSPSWFRWNCFDRTAMGDGGREGHRRTIGGKGEKGLWERQRGKGRGGRRVKGRRSALVVGIDVPVYRLYVLWALYG